MTIQQHLDNCGINYEGCILYVYMKDVDILVRFTDDFEQNWSGGLYLRNPLAGLDIIIAGDSIKNDMDDVPQHEIHVSDDGIHAKKHEFKFTEHSGFNKWNELIEKHNNINKLISKI